MKHLFVRCAVILAAMAILFTGCPTQPEEEGTEVSFTGLTANGSADAVTTGILKLTFSDSITGLTAGDITLSGTIANTVIKGTLTETGVKGTYELPISGFTAAGTLTVKVVKTGYKISPDSLPVEVFYKEGSQPEGTQGKVIIVGNPVVTNELKAYAYDLGITEGNAYFDWYADGEKITRKAGEDGWDFIILEDAQIGKKITVKATNPKDTTKTVLSGATSTVVAKADFQRSLQVIGIPAKGKELKAFADGIENTYIHWYADGVEIQRKEGEGGWDYIILEDAQVGKKITAMAGDDNNYVWWDGQTGTVQATWSFNITVTGEARVNGLELKVSEKPGNTVVDWYVNGVLLPRDPNNTAWGNDYFWPQDEHIGKSIQVKVQEYDNKTGVEYAWHNFGTIKPLSSDAAYKLIVIGTPAKGKELKAFASGIENKYIHWYADGIEIQRKEGEGGWDYIILEDAQVGKRITAMAGDDNNYVWVDGKTETIQANWSFSFTPSGDARVGGNDLRVDNKPENVIVRWYVNGVEVEGQESWGSDWFRPEESHVGKSIQVRVSNYDDWWGINLHDWHNFGIIKALSSDPAYKLVVIGTPAKGKELKAFATGIENDYIHWYANGVEIQRKEGEGGWDYVILEDAQVGKKITAMAGDDSNYVWWNSQTETIQSEWTYSIKVNGQPIYNPGNESATELKVTEKGNSNSQCRWFINGVEIPGQESWGDDYFWPKEEHLGQSIQVLVRDWDNATTNMHDWHNFGTIKALSSDTAYKLIVIGTPAKGKQLKAFASNDWGEGKTYVHWYADGVEIQRKANEGGWDYIILEDAQVGKQITAQATHWDDSNKYAWWTGKTTTIQANWSFSFTPSGDARVGGNDLRVDNKPENVIVRWYVNGVEVEGQESWGSDWFRPEESHVGKSIQVRVSNYDDWWGINLHDWHNFGIIKAKDAE